MKIKICGLTNARNLSGVIQLLPDLVGFIFYPGSKRYAGDDKELLKCIAALSGVEKVGVFVNATEPEIMKVTRECRLDRAQLHGQETSAFCKEIAKTIPVIKAFPVDERFDFNSLRNYEGPCTSFLFDTASPHYAGLSHPTSTLLPRHSGPDLKSGLAPEYGSSLQFRIESGMTIGRARSSLARNTRRMNGTALPHCGGTGKTFDWALLDRYELSTPFFLSGGISIAHLPAINALAHPALTGIDVNSRFETVPGTKDIQLLKTLLYEIRH